MTIASPARTSTCDWSKTAYSSLGRCPKGLPTKTEADRLAVEVSDHDLDHLTYEDEHKFIADIGWWEARTSQRPTVRVRTARKRGNHVAMP